MATNYLLRRSSLHLAGSLGALCLILLAAIVTAESFDSNNNNNAHQQEATASLSSSSLAGSGSSPDGLLSGDFAVATSNNNYQQQQPPQSNDGYGNNGGQSSGSKSKKIQIVYIKVPLAKLRPSMSGQDSHGSAGNSSAVTKSNEQYETNDSKSHQQQHQQQHLAAGSQQQQQINNGGADELQQQQLNLNDFTSDGPQQTDAVGTGTRGASTNHQSFLIPMALVQTSSSQLQPSLSSEGSESPSSSGVNHYQGDSTGPSTFNYELARYPLIRDSSQYYANFNNMMLGSAGSQLHPQHVQPQQQSPSFYSTPQLSDASLSNQQPALASFSGRIRSPSMQLHQFIRNQQNSIHPLQVPHGFMSNFLLGEKEKMTAAATAMLFKQQRQHQQASQAESSAPSSSTTITADRHQLSPQVASAASEANQQPVSAPSNNNDQSALSSLNPKGPGGLMPSMMAPLSRMPDNALGQAYGAAVGIALPAESGSPSSLLSSPSTQSNYGNKQQLGAVAPSASNQTTNYATNSNNANNYGTSSGTPGEGASSSGTGSSTSYGASGPNQLGAGSSGRNYQQSQQGYAAIGQSSGYGNGISTSGGSGAFSDFPQGQSAGSSNPYNHQQQPGPQQQQHGGSIDYNGQQRLKQAKKTIIPIVVQVEHAILENSGNNAAVANAYQMQQQQARPAGNKYGGGRSQRQLGGKRGSRYNNSGHKQQQQGNQLYGAATNEIAQYGDIPPGAQWVNAANAYDINQITAQINAENAASAAAALAQADAAFGPSAPAGFSPPNQSNQAGARYPVHRPMGGHSGGQSSAGQQQPAYSAGLQSAASALLANTHPMIQAAASGGLASVSKLGAKLGEMIALPSMQMPNSIASIGSSLPSAFSSITNQMGAQFGQAVQQVAKEHPHVSAFARQVAQQAGIQFPNFGGQQAPAGNPVAQMAVGNQQQAAASNQHMSQLSPQAQLQNLKLSIGQNLQTAAASLIGVNQKANALAGSQLLVDANQMALSAALKQLSAISPTAAQLANQLAGSVQAAASNQQQTAVAPPHDIGLTNNQQVGALNQFFQQQQQVYNQLANMQQAAAGQQASPEPAGSANSLETSASSTKPVKSTSFKSKFLSFFQPPKFISNFLSWSDRADMRSDKGETDEMYLDLSTFADNLDGQSKNSTKTASNSSTTLAMPDVLTTTAAVVLSSKDASNVSTTLKASTSTSKQPQVATSLAPPTTLTATSSTSAAVVNEATTVNRPAKSPEKPGSATNSTTTAASIKNGQS